MKNLPKPSPLVAKLARFAGLLVLVGSFGSARAATITVNSTNDPAGYNPNITVATLGTTVTLRDAFNAAVNGGGANTIVFDPGLAGQTIYLTQLDGNAGTPTALGMENRSALNYLTIQGLTGNAGITISRSGANQMRLFFCGDGNLDTLTINDLTLTGGIAPAGNWGGAIELGLDGSVTLNRCTVSGNSAYYGGAFYNVQGYLYANDCTIVSNTALYTTTYPDGQGGAVYLYLGLAYFNNCTFTGNSAYQAGGLFSYFSDHITLVNSIVANDNVSLNLPEIVGRLASGSQNNLCSDPGTTGGNDNGAGGMANGVNGNILGVNPLLGPLANNGGPTMTMALLPGSPAINAGTNIAGITTDQRGYPFYLAPDIGAYEAPPMLPAITSANGVVFTSGLSNSFQCIATGNPLPTLREAGALPAGVSFTNGWLSGLPLVGTEGIYPITLIATNTSSNGIIQTASQNFTLTIARTGLEVTTVVDEDNGNPWPTNGTGTSLREALDYAATLAGPQIITFAPGLAGQTIQLTNAASTINGSSALVVADTLTIQGLSGSSGITIANASGGTLRLFLVNGGNLTLNNLTLTNGSASNYGGAIFCPDYNVGSLKLNGCTLAGNSASSFGGAIDTAAAICTLVDCTLANNHAGVNGGAIHTDSGTLTLVNVTVAYNTCGLYSAGIAVSGLSYLTNTILANNSGNNTEYDIYGSVSGADNLTYDFYGGRSGGLVNGVNGNQVDSSPLQLGSLSNNGGPTPTIPLMYGSVAINAGLPIAVITTDQRGMPIAGTPDIGAYEYGAPAFTSPNQVVFLAGFSNSFSFSATGVPAPTFALTGSLPAGISFNGSALTGLASNTAVGSYPLTLTATNGLSPNATQSFTLIVQAPSLVVSTTNDPASPLAGQNSLREALAYAQSLAGTQAITFAPALVAGGPATVMLAQTGDTTYGASALGINSAVTIEGPAGLNGVTLAISSTNTLRHFYVGPTGMLTLSNLTLSGGTAADHGGSISSFGALDLYNCTFTRNSSQAQGGAIHAWGGATSLVIVNSTFAGNSSVTEGGAIVSGANTNSLTYLTIVDNTSGGGAYWQYQTTITLVDSIVARNLSNGIPSDIVTFGTGGFSAQSVNNLIGTGGSGNLVNGVGGNLVGVATANLYLGALAANGGPAQTVALLAGSPAINAGVAVPGITTDQRGVSRLVAGQDIGAFEYVVSPAISSANSTIFLTGVSNTFTFAGTGVPAPGLTLSGALPSGVSFTGSGLAGTPTGSGGVYSLTVTATNGIAPAANQTFSLAVVGPNTFAAHPNFETNGLGWALNGDSINGGPNITNNVFTPTDGTGGETRSAWFRYPLYVGAFQASFTYQDVGTNGADGTAFVIQNSAAGTTAIGGGGGELGYVGISPSVALMLDIYAGAPGGPSGWLVTTDGAGDGGGYSSTNYQSTAPVNLDGGDPINVSLRYTGSVLQMNFTDTVTSVTFRTNVPINIPAFVGTNAAWVGFTGSEGGVLSHQAVSNFSYTPLPTLIANASSPNTRTLSWPATAYGFQLQSTPALNGVWTNVTAAVSQANNLNQVTIAASGTQFFRLVLP